jgi:hypothetical protein
MIIIQVFITKIVIMNSTRIIDIVKFVYFKQANVPLGRWTNHNHKQTILKIKYANEDNCGVSGMIYTNTPQPPKKQQKQVQIVNQSDDNEYIYFMGYESIHK